MPAWRNAIRRSSGTTFVRRAFVKGGGRLNCLRGLRINCISPTVLAEILPASFLCPRRKSARLISVQCQRGSPDASSSSTRPVPDDAVPRLVTWQRPALPASVAWFNSTTERIYVLLTDLPALSVQESPISKLRAVFPTLLHQDPRYFRRGTGSKWSRLGYAMGQIFWTHHDSGGTRFNLFRDLGNSVAVAISNAYYPDNRTAADAVSKLGMQVGVDMAANVLKEFWPEIERRFRRQHR